MIRLANEQDFVREISSESELRICALKKAYGLDVPFIQFFADGEGSIASIMDGFCALYCHTDPNEEWITFLQMHSDIRTIHSDADTIAALAKNYGVEAKNGVVLRFDNVLSKCTLHYVETQNISLRKLYAFLTAVFDDLPSFDAWYVDASHRVRHGCCHITSVNDDGRMISTAMTVAETDTVALIGGVATLPAYRMQGAASRCIKDLIAALPQETVLIAPSDEYAARLYHKLGFVPWGTWAELTLP